MKEKLLMKAHFVENTEIVAKQISKGEELVLITNSIIIEYFKHHYISQRIGKFTIYIVSKKFMESLIYRKFIMHPSALIRKLL